MLVLRHRPKRCRIWLRAMCAGGRARRVAAHPVAVAAVLRAAPATPVSSAGVDVRPTAGGVSAEADRPQRIGQLVEQVESDPARRRTSVKGPDLPCHPVIEWHERAVVQGVADRCLQRSQLGEVDVDEVRCQRLAQGSRHGLVIDARVAGVGLGLGLLLLRVPLVVALVASGAAVAAIRVLV